ncbi:DNA-binding response regulator [Paracoccus sp. JM45]|nr:DNA-binding response regulator [Paracoccus sp. JM45]
MVRIPATTSICKLRKKLSEALGGESHIETVWGRGYVLREPAASAQPVAISA